MAEAKERIANEGPVIPDREGSLEQKRWAAESNTNLGGIIALLLHSVDGRLGRALKAGILSVEVACTASFLEVSKPIMLRAAA